MTRKTDPFAFLDRSRGDPDVFPLEVRRSEFREISLIGTFTRARIAQRSLFFG